MIADLADRGYDITTLKLEVSIDPSQLEKKFPQLWAKLSEEEKIDLFK